MEHIKILKSINLQRDLQLEITDGRTDKSVMCIEKEGKKITKFIRKFMFWKKF